MLVEEDKLQFLQKTELFAELPEAELKAISQIANEVAYPAGAMLFEEGDEGDSLYLIVDGKVRHHQGGNRGTVLR